jgi:hypothetical protein
VNMSAANKITYDEFPALYRASDKASITAQKQFARLTAAYMLLMILAAIVGSVALSSPSGKMALALTSAIFLTLSAFLRIAVRAMKVEQVWYDGRAVAESVKTMAWHYMTGADPYAIGLGPKADTLFITGLSSLLNERKTFAARLASKLSTNHQITDRMRVVRSWNTEERKNYYLSQRIDDQRRWYGEKTEANSKAADRFFAGMVISQALGVIAAFSIAIWPESPIRATGIFTTLATSLLAWTQMRRNDQLAQSYGLATQELNLIHEEATQIRTDGELSAYVGNSENAISREHTMWMARRS